MQHNIPLEQHGQNLGLVSQSQQETHVHIDVLLPKRAEMFGSDSSIRMEKIRAASNGIYHNTLDIYSNPQKYSRKDIIENEFINENSTKTICITIQSNGNF